MERTRLKLAVIFLLAALMLGISLVFYLFSILSA